MRVSMLLTTDGSDLVMQESWEIMPSSLCRQTSLLGFCTSFMIFDLIASNFRRCPQTAATLMCTEHWNSTRYLTCSAIHIINVILIIHIIFKQIIFIYIWWSAIRDNIRSSHQLHYCNLGLVVNTFRMDSVDDRLISVRFPKG
jgi:hypothetical protein